jgi:hypothetical protein
LIGKSNKRQVNRRQTEGKKLNGGQRPVFAAVERGTETGFAGFCFTLLRQSKKQQ